MPIYMHIEGLRGDVSSGGSSSANGGVWKTTSFLTRDAAANAHVARPQIKVFVCPSDPGVVRISRMSLAGGANAVDGHDATAKFKVEHLLNIARSHGPNGKLYVATEAGVYQNSSPFDAQGRLLMGTEGGVWRSGVREAANRMRSTNNLKQLGLGSHNASAVEIIVTDASGTVLGAHRLQNATISSHSGGILVALGDGSVR